MAFQLIAGFKHPAANAPKRRIDAGEHDDTGNERAIGAADHAAAETIDHVEERIEVRRDLKRFRQELDISNGVCFGVAMNCLRHKRY